MKFFVPLNDSSPTLIATKMPVSLSLPQDDLRAGKLSRLLDQIVTGKQPLSNSKQGELFIEAICAQPDPATCINKIITSPKGLFSVQACMRFNTSPAFFNGLGTSLIFYLQDPALRTISGGDLLHQIILIIVEPPIFWEAFVQAYKGDKLTQQAQQCFGWLLLELISLPNKQSLPYHVVAQDGVIQERLLNSSEVTIRMIGQKIKHILTTIATPGGSGNEGPGGRHDNDFPDFREIAILPTADELTSQEPVFLRIAQELENPDTEEFRISIHLDNQFRLLREDMIGEIREELQIALGHKKGRHKGVILDGFIVKGMSCGESRKRLPWGIHFESTNTFNQLFKTNAKDRRVHLSNNRNILRHQSLVCLVLDGQVTAFPTLNRDQDMLTKDHPIVILEFKDEASIFKTILELKSAKHIRLINIDTAVFSYEPVLRRLQEIKGLTLSNELLFWQAMNPIEQPPTPPITIVNSIQADPLEDLQVLLGTSKPIKLDSSQRSSLLMGLNQRVSLIQGPPGE